MGRKASTGTSPEQGVRGRAGRTPERARGCGMLGALARQRGRGRGGRDKRT